MSYVMMQLGGYQFALETAAYQQLTRTTAYRWPKQEVYGTRPVGQFTGPGEETITLQGVIYPEFRGGFGQVDAMRGEAETGVPLLLVSGEGLILGYYCIEEITETHSTFAAFGLPLKIEFGVKLSRFDD